VNGRATVVRSELALAALAATAILLEAIVLLDVLRFHIPALITGEHPALDRHTVALSLLALAQSVVVWRAVRSLRRQIAVDRRLRSLPVVERRLVGRRVAAIVADPRPVAFCAGLRRPTVFVTTGALARLEGDELQAVVEHEAHHARRRDPLRLLVARLLAEAFAFPTLRDLPDRQHATADLAADAAAVAAAGTPRPLAAALLRFPDPRPERVDQLLGLTLPAGSRALLACTLLATAGLGALAVGIALAPEDPALPTGALIALSLPSLIACRRRLHGIGR
jgi:hypothetical protein